MEQKNICASVRFMKLQYCIGGLWQNMHKRFYGKGYVICHKLSISICVILAV